MPPTEIPNTVTFAMFQDPEGNMIELAERVMRPRPKPRPGLLTLTEAARLDILSA